MSFIEIQNLSKIIHGKTILEKINLSFNLNEFVCIIGKSGTGKTTLLNSIGLIDKNIEGTIKINNKTINKRNYNRMRKSFFSFVFQDYGLVPYLNPEENIEQFINKENKPVYVELLRKLGLNGKINCNICNLSGGEKQRFGILKSFIKNNKIIIADEPTGSLDTNNSENIMQLLKDRSEGRLIIMATHNIELAEKYASRIITIDEGKIVDDRVLREVKHLEVAEYIQENPKESNIIKLKQTYKFLKREKRIIIPMILLISLCFCFLILLIGSKSGLQSFINSTQNQIKDARYIEIESNNIEMFENYLNKYQIKYKECFNYDFFFNNLLKRQITENNHINFDYSIKVLETSEEDGISLSCNSLFYNLFDNVNFNLDIEYILFDSFISYKNILNIQEVYIEPYILNIPKLYISEQLANLIINDEIKDNFSSQEYIHLPRKIYCFSPLNNFYNMCTKEPQIDFLRRNSVENTYFLINSSSYPYYIPLQDLINSFSYILVLLIVIVLIIIFSLFSFLLKTFYTKREREYALYYAFGESLKEIEKRVKLQNIFILMFSFLISIILSICLSYLLNPWFLNIFSSNNNFKLLQIEPKGIICALYCCLTMFFFSSLISSERKIERFVEVLKNE